MRRLTVAVAVFLTGAALPAPGLKDAAPKPDPIVGMWKQESIGIDGKVQPERDDRRWEFTADGKYQRYRGGQKAWDEGVPYHIDPKADPKALDVGRGILAVYKIEGDTLTVCVAQNELKTRPTGFEMLKNSNTALYVFKRVKSKD